MTLTAQTGWGQGERAGISLSVAAPPLLPSYSKTLSDPSPALDLPQTSHPSWTHHGLFESPLLPQTETATPVFSNFSVSLSEYLYPLDLAPESVSSIAAQRLLNAGAEVISPSDRHLRHPSRLFPHTNLYFSSDATKQRLRAETLLNKLDNLLAHWEFRLGISMNEHDLNNLMNLDLDVFLGINAHKSESVPPEYAALKHRATLIRNALMLSYLHGVQLYIFENGTVSFPDGTCGIVLEKDAGFVFESMDSLIGRRYTHSLFAGPETKSTFFRNAFKYTLGTAALYYQGNRYVLAANSNGKVISCYDENDRHFDVVEKDPHFMMEPSPPHPNGFISNLGVLCRLVYRNGEFHASFRQIWHDGEIGFVFDKLKITLNAKGEPLPVSFATPPVKNNVPDPAPPQLPSVYWPYDEAWRQDGSALQEEPETAFKHRGGEWRFKKNFQGLKMLGQIYGNDKTVPKNFMLFKREGDDVIPLDADVMMEMIETETLPLEHDYLSQEGKVKGIPYDDVRQGLLSYFLNATTTTPPYPLLIPDYPGVKVLTFEMKSLLITSEKNRHLNVKIPFPGGDPLLKIALKNGYYLPQEDDILAFVEIMSQKIPTAFLKRIAEIHFYPTEGIGAGEDGKGLVQGSYRVTQSGKDVVYFYGVKAKNRQEWLKQLTGRVLTHEVLGHGTERNNDEIRTLILMAMMLDNATSQYGDTNWREYFSVMTEYLIHEPELQHRFPWSFRVVNHFIRKAAQL